MILDINLGTKVEVIKGRKPPVGTAGTVFWKGKYDSHGAFGILRIGIKTSEGQRLFVDAKKTKIIKE